jgi:phosphoglycolate phosphatase
LLGARPEEALMIGDSLNDVLAARAAGCAVWCVPYGYNEGQPVGTLDCDAVVADFVDAAGRLERGRRGVTPG